MMNSLFSFEEFDSQEALLGHCSDGTEKQSHFFEAEEDLGGLDYLWSGYDLYKENSFEKEEAVLPIDDQRCFSDFVAMDDMQFDKIVPSETETEKSSSLSYISELLGPEKEKACPELPSDNLLNGEKLNEMGEKESDPAEEGQELSTEDVMRVAGAHYIQLSVEEQGEDYPSMLRHPLRFMFSGYGDEDVKKVELAGLLLAATEKVSNQQYDRARKLLAQCARSASDTGDPVQRVIYYFSKALRERIERETRRASSKEPAPRDRPAEYVLNAFANPHPIHLITHKLLPFTQVMQFTSIQTILDNMASAKRIHLIDLGIKNGVQWTILMQALAERITRPVEHLKISAVGASEEAIAETGKRLVSFAETLSLPFDFKAVIVSDMKDLKGDMFELEDEEEVGIYCSMVLASMLVRPASLENIMKVMKKLNPCIMTVMDVQANINSISLVNRFIETLFTSSNFFDCLDACMDRNDRNRISMEANFIYPGIRNIVVAEGSERIVRYVGLDVWRSFFARFGLVEAEMSEWSLYQAGLLVEQFPCGSHCTVEIDGKSMTVGWKGTPIHFVSAWKFHC